jgi:predicted nuclease of predicted toxin-antitoxin system
VRFLIDRCAGKRLADRLRQQEHDVFESQERGADPGDRNLLAWAHSEQRVLITMDKDFGKLVFHSGEAHSGLIRLPDVPAEERIALMDVLLTWHQADLLSGAVITVKGDRIRISRSQS